MTCLRVLTKSTRSNTGALPLCYLIQVILVNVEVSNLLAAGRVFPSYNSYDRSGRLTQPI